MKEILQHFRRRAFAISFNTLRTLMPAVAGFAISVVVVRFYSKELWGAASATMLWVYLASNISSWGSREFVLREISRYPENMFVNWGNSVVSRLVLLMAVLVAVFITTASLVLASLLCVCICSRFIYQSFDPVVIYKNSFAFVVAVEMVSLAFFVLFLFLIPYRDLQHIIIVYAFTDALKAIAVSLFFREFIRPYRIFKFDWRYFTRALPFFLLGISQLLHARISQFFVNTWLPNSDKAFYQVYTNLLLYMSAIPDIMVTPFLKTLFVSGKKVFRQVLSVSLLASLVIVPAVLAFIFIVLTSVYHFEVTNKQLLLGGLFALPEFYYALRMYYFYSIDREKTVVIINVICVAVASAMSFWLIPGHGLNGALISAVVSQWLTALLYFVFV